MTRHYGKGRRLEEAWAYIVDRWWGWSGKVRGLGGRVCVRGNVCIARNSSTTSKSICLETAQWISGKFREFCNLLLEHVGSVLEVSRRQTANSSGNEEEKLITKVTVFWNVKSCSSECGSQRIGEHFCLHLQGRRVKHGRGSGEWCKRI
jgi:hypothetical protein